MYKRDLITAEIEKLSQVLARILGLKVALKLDEARSLFAETLTNSFGLEIDMLYNQHIELFEQWIAETDLPAEKLDMLGQFIFKELETSNEEHIQQTLAKKLSLVYQVLANKYHIVHLSHLDQLQQIKRYL